MGLVNRCHGNADQVKRPVFDNADFRRGMELPKRGA